MNNSYILSLLFLVGMWFEFLWLESISSHMSRTLERGEGGKRMLLEIKLRLYRLRSNIQIANSLSKCDEIHDDDVLITKKKIPSLAFHKTLIFKPKQKNQHGLTKPLIFSFGLVFFSLELTFSNTGIISKCKVHSCTHQHFTVIWLIYNRQSTKGLLT